MHTNTRTRNVLSWRLPLVESEFDPTHTRRAVTGILLKIMLRVVSTGKAGAHLKKVSCQF